MTLEDAADAVRAYIKEKGYEGGRYRSEWLDIVDEAVTEIRVELANGPVVFGKAPVWGEQEAVE
ncbi:hypothetical protein [Sinorhizobium americanum]|uniref:Uncharacterized protein n=1 Tax=Sinorhizobium americanum TaxID=194963 RepID=A0A1L3LM00_9HYPH|nr:hypothetical protein [Sinorhizobium americanum]APG91129.1 hypothetical protein SAMCFNEI73_Ch1839 [Sinorhizobium americanum]OAP43708.1 hypothetical protein ATC00_02375 [Sinorhizobium americanum]